MLSSEAAIVPRRPYAPKMSSQQQSYITLVTHKGVRFLITDQPSLDTMAGFIQACQLHEVCALVRACESNYDTEPLESAGIRVIDLEFDDGAPPPEDILALWFQLVLDVFHSHTTGCIAVHCKAGLGRAPALVAVALIEMGLPFDEAIELIRTQRRGAFNARQIQFLKNYRPRKRLRQIQNQADKCHLI